MIFNRLSTSRYCFTLSYFAQSLLRAPYLIAVIYSLCLISFPTATHADNTSHKHWFAFTPKNDTSTPSALSMQQWLTQSALTEPLQSKKSNIENHNIIKKIWGTNVNYANNAPTKDDAIKRTQFFAKYGINSVRLHKLTNSSWEGLGSTNSASQYDPEKMARFDFWLNQLKKSGISYGFSPIWDLRLFPDDQKNLLAYDEIINAKPNKPTTTGLVWFAPDIQQLHIDTLINLLNHKNPHTHLRYADDSSLAYVEIQNEENIFFYSFFNNVKKYPSYHRLLAQQFSLWLKSKYKTHANLISYWGGSAIDAFTKEGSFSGEALHKKNITPFINPWWFDQTKTSGKYKKRLQDTAEFLFEKQQTFYEKTRKAIRDTGFKGLIVNSNWQAGSTGAHFLNLLSDSNGDIIDRHNYQGGAEGDPAHLIKEGFILKNHTMLDQPGSGLLSTGMQQVIDTPFMLSEWLSVVPSEYAAADTTIIAAYGFGLQGWDMSYHFASDGNGFTPTLSNKGGKFSNLNPVGVGLFPILSRMVLRGDIHEGKTIATRRLSKNQAINNDYDFLNTTDQTHDLKSFSGTPHHASLAAGKVLIEFTDKDSHSSINDWEKTYSTQNNDQSTTITASNNQLAWTFKKERKHSGFITINSDGTQGIIGFAKGKKNLLKNMNVTSHSPYAVILGTAKDPQKTIATDKEILIVAIARAHNTGMHISNEIIKKVGQAPIILEPVKATINFKRKATITVLDHDGIITDTAYTTKEGVFELDTGRDKSIYYLVSFDDV